MKPTFTLLAGTVTALLSGALAAHEAGGADHGHLEPQRSLLGQAQLIAKRLQNQVKIFEEGGKRIVEANNIPDHSTGTGARGRNPHSISEKDNRYEMTLTPEFANQPTSSFPNAFGVALNGVFFEPSTAEFWQGDRNWNEEAIDGRGRRKLGLDIHHAHVQPDGSYHYHGTPTGLIKSLVAKQKDRVLLLGYAADGFPIYGQYGYSEAEDADSQVKKLTSSYQLKRGRRGRDSPPGNYDGTYGADYEYVAGKGDLDEFNGRFGVTPEYPQGIYHYVITDTYPFISRAWRGTPDPSFFKRRGGGGGAGPGGDPGGGPGGTGPGGRDRPPHPGDRPPHHPPPRR